MKLSEKEILHFLWRDAEKIDEYELPELSNQKDSLYDRCQELRQDTSLLANGELLEEESSYWNVCETIKNLENRRESLLAACSDFEETDAADDARARLLIPDYFEIIEREEKRFKKPKKKLSKRRLAILREQKTLKRLHRGRGDEPFVLEFNDIGMGAGIQTRILTSGNRATYLKRSFHPEDGGRNQ